MATSRLHSRGREATAQGHDGEPATVNRGKTIIRAVYFRSNLFPSIQPRRSVACALLTMVVAMGLPPIRAAESAVIAELRQRTGDQVRHFEQAFTLVISDETNRQYGEGATLNWHGDADLSRYEQADVGHVNFPQRQTVAEMLFLWLPQEQTWLTVRNVLTACRVF